MKRFIFTLLAGLSVVTAGHAAGASLNRQALLDSILRNNTTLTALRQQVVSGKAENRTELRLPDPDFDFAYLWGSPTGTPARKDFGVSQQLDWGTLTGQRRRVARTADERLERAYDVEVQAIVAEADQALVNLTYYNRLCAELQRRAALAQEMQALYDKKFAEGDIDRMALNKVRLNRSMATAELQRAEAERQDVLATLRRLNGGREVVCHDTLYDAAPLPALTDFLTAVSAHNPTVAAARAAIDEGKAQVKLDRTLALPALTVGYTGEYIKGQNYSGVSVGVSLPLWGNGRKKVEQSKAALAGAELDLADATAQLTSEVERLYATALRLRQTADQLAADLAATDNAPLLRRALDAGRLSLPEYLLELSFYYEARTQWLEAERDAQLARSELLTMLPYGSL